jgi:hypothetical protein
MKCKFCNTTVEKPTFDIGNTAISNTMDNQLAMGVLNDALAKHPHPEIFNCSGLTNLDTKIAL